MPASRPRTPLDQPRLEQLALRYVERFATTEAKLARYLERKIRERGWGAEEAPAPAAVAARMAELGYVDDAAFAEARAGAMARRGLGARRVTGDLRQAGIAAPMLEALRPAIEEEAEASALAFARRRRIGPYAAALPDRPAREKALAQMLRAGHSLDLARRIIARAPGEFSEE